MISLSNKKNGSQTKFASEQHSMSLVIWIVVSVIGVILFLMSSIGLFTPLQDFFDSATSGMRATIFSDIRKLELLANSFNNYPELVSENEQLREENIELESRLGRIERAFIENEYLRRQLGVEFEQDYRQIGVLFLGFESSEKNELIVNKGSRDGVNEADVLVVGDIVLGRVVRVGEFSSVVELLSAPDTSIPVKSLSGNLGILRATGAQNFQVTEVLQSQEVKIDEFIYTSGLGGEYPPNLLIGKVVSIDSDERESTKSLEVRPLGNINQLDQGIILSLPEVAESNSDS